MRVRLSVLVVVMAAVVLLAAALAVCVILGPWWLVGSGDGLTAAERLRAANDIRATLLQGLGGLLALGGVALGAAMTLRQVKANREGHSIDLFTKAIDRMASEHMSVRQGGDYFAARCPPATATTWHHATTLACHRPR
jgi:H+/Cl- antiporter ClcA